MGIPGLQFIHPSYYYSFIFVFIDLANQLAKYSKTCMKSDKIAFKIPPNCLQLWRLERSADSQSVGVSLAVRSVLSTVCIINLRNALPPVSDGIMQINT